MTGESDEERIETLEGEALVAEDRLEKLEGEAIVADDRLEKLEAEALLAGEQIADLTKQVDSLHGAMEYRAEIEQAKGVIMRTTKCNAHAAFALLVVQSQTENRKLRDIAIEIAAAQAQ